MLRHKTFFFAPWNLLFHICWSAWSQKLSAVDYIVYGSQVNWTQNCNFSITCSIFHLESTTDEKLLVKQVSESTTDEKIPVKQVSESTTSEKFPVKFVSENIAIESMLVKDKRTSHGAWFNHEHAATILECRDRREQSRRRESSSEICDERERFREWRVRGEVAADAGGIKTL